jgi:iron complex transport system substrate-binding protein
MVRLYAEALDRYVDVPDEPSRIVSLAPAITETLFMLGLGDRIAGVSLYCNKPREAREKPRVGSYWKVMYSRLEPLNPDLILVTTGAQLKVLRELVEKGYTVYPISLPVTVNGILEYIVKVGMAVNRFKEARRLAWGLEAELAKLRGALDGVKLYYEIDLGGPVAPAAYTYIVDALEYLGVETPFSNTRDTWLVNPDVRSVVEFNPDVVVFEAPYGVEDLLGYAMRRLEERGLGGLDAVKSGRLVVLEPDSLAHYGPSFFRTLSDLTARVKSVLNVRA